MSTDAEFTPHILDLLPALALGSLEPEEEKAARSHMRKCQACENEYRAMVEVMEKFSLAAPQVSPPPRLRAAILRQARLTKPDARFARKKPDWLSDLSAILRKPGMVWMAASLAIILILAVGNLYQWRAGHAVVATPPASHFSVISMAAVEAAASAEGILVISPDGRYGTLVVNGMEPLVAGKEYQLWLIVGENRVSGGVFTVGSSGYGALKVESPQPLSEYNQFGITIEPSGGSQQPTGKRVLGSEL